MGSEQQPVDYKTHVLIGVRASGTMTALCTWPYVPRQAEVQEQMAATREAYDTFILCTPTSIMPGNSDTARASRREHSRSSGLR
jgi:hypothetical protein